MTIFSYKATDRSGNEVSGRTNAATKDELVSKLEKEGLYLNSWKEVVENAAAPGTAALPAINTPWVRKLVRAWRNRNEAYTDYRQIHGHLNYKNLATITWQMAIGLKSGITLTEMLSTISRETTDKKTRFIFNFLFEKVNAGHTLADGLAFFPSVFSTIYVNLVHAGEAGGFLPKSLEEAAAYLKKQDRLNKKIKSMLIYPVMLAVIASCIITFMATYIMPIFLELFTNMNVELPLVTKLLLFTFGLFRKFIFAWMGLLLLTAFYVRKVYRDIGSNLLVDTVILRLPALGTLMLKIAVSRFLGTLSILLRTGVNILDALLIGKAVSGNTALGREIEAIYTAVESGKPMAEKMIKSRYFPAMVAMMVANGEKSGNLPEALERVADYYVEEVDISIADTLALMEPLIVVVMGIFIGLVATGLLIPIFELPGYVE